MTDELKVKIINKLYPIELLIEDSIEGGKNIHCIFHNDYKPSSIIYKDSNAVWCFTCKRFFYPINYINKLKINIEHIFNELKMLYPGIDLEMEFNNINITKEKKKNTTYFKKPPKNIIEFSKEYFR